MDSQLEHKTVQKTKITEEWTSPQLEQRYANFQLKMAKIRG